MEALLCVCCLIQHISYPARYDLNLRRFVCSSLSAPFLGTYRRDSFCAVPLLLGEALPQLLGMSSLFSQPAGGSLFGQNNAQQQQNNTNPFGAATNNQSKPTTSLFGSTNTTTASSQAPAGTGLFGSTSQPPQTSSGFFGALGATTNNQPQQTGSGLFGAQPQQNSLFGNLEATNNQQNQHQNQSQQGGSLFGGFGQNAQQQPQNQQQSQQQNQPPQGSFIGQPRQFMASENGPRMSRRKDCRLKFRPS